MEQETPLKSIESFSEEELSLIANQLEDDSQDPLSQDEQSRLEVPPMLSFGQERLWFIEQVTGGSAQYNIPAALRLRGDLDAQALELSLSFLVQRHSALRSAFRSDGQGGAVVEIAAEARLKLGLADLRSLPAGERENEAMALLSEEARREFRLDEPPLLRALLIRLEERAHFLALTLHHIVGDAWSAGVLVRELGQVYSAFAQRQKPHLPELELAYVDYACWQRKRLSGEFLRRQLAYWREQLDGLEALSLPLDRPRPPMPSYRGARCELLLDSELSARLRQLGRQESATLFMVLLAGWQLLLARCAGQSDIAVGTPISNRPEPRWEPVVGFFVNTLVLRTKLIPGDSFRQLLKKVRQTCLGAYEHQDMPFERLVEELAPARDSSQNPLIQTMFSLQNAQIPPLELKGMNISLLPVGADTAKLDLALQAAEVGSQIWLSLEYGTDVFGAATAELLLERLQMALEQVAAEPDRPVGEVSLLADDERRQVLVEWNKTESDYPKKCLHDLVEEQVARTPDAIAVVFEGSELSYEELNHRANHLAHYLMNLGVGAEARVGICMERSLEMVVGLLGILKAGAAYVPLDPEYPQERLQFMIEDAGIEVLITQRKVSARLPHTRAVVALDEQQEAIANTSADNPESRASADSLAYIIFTSGYTGRPKGVLVQHGGVCNALFWMIKEFKFEKTDVVLHKNVFTFDASVWEVFVPLFIGAKLVVAQPDGHRDSSYLVRLIIEHGITSIHFIPPMLPLFLQERELAKVISLRQVFSGGDSLSFQLMRAFFDRFHLELGKSVELFNSYGPTETSIRCLSWPCRHNDENTVAIGRPATNTQVYVLDANMEPVPVGIGGELYIGGDGVTRGYLNRPELTAERFLPDRFGAQAGARLYRTGDLVRWRPDANLEFLGRMDEQVKLRGFRIELGEIEAVLREHEEVSEAVVMAGQDRSGQKRLVGYAVVRDGGETDGSELRRYLKERLPSYMVPAGVMVIEEMPLLPNGKLDRKRMPEWSVRGGGEESGEEEQTETEEKVGRIWARVLEVERVGREEDFFERGGHSLLVTQVVSRVREELGVEVSVRSMFEKSRMKEFAKEVEERIEKKGGEGAGERIERVRREGAMGLSYSQQRLWFVDQLKPDSAAYNTAAAAIELSYSQQRLWFIDQLEPDSSAYNIAAAARLKGQLDVRALSETLNEIVRRHEVLRTRFGQVQGKPAQWVEANIEFHLQIEDLRGLGEKEREEEAKQKAAVEAARPFSLGRAPLLRARLLRLRDDEYALLLTTHHIVSDGWSSAIMLRELSQLYEAYANGEKSPLPELKIQYADYAVWQRKWLQGEVLEEQLGYWRDQLKDLPALDLPTDNPRPAQPSHKGAVEEFRVPPEVVRRLRQVCRAEGVTLFMLLLAAFQIVLRRWSGQDAFAIGSPIANRNRKELESLIGFFANTLVLRADLKGNPRFRELLGQVRETCLEAYAHQDVPFEQLVDELVTERDLSRSPLFQVIFALQNVPMGAINLSRLTLSPMKVQEAAVKYDLEFSMLEVGDELRGNLVYSVDLYEPQTAARLLEHLMRVLEQVGGDAGRRIEDLDLLGDEERQQVLVEWNQTRLEFLPERWVHEIFETQVEKSPEALAVVFQDQTLSYAELNERANRLAGYLRKLGIGPEVRVGVCLERGLEMLVGLFGVLKAGGAYVPLDPEYPVERLGYMIEDAQIPVLLTQSHLLGGLPDTTARIVALDADWERINECNCANLPSGLSGDNAAYVIYTSGSTGRPKGVVVTHHAVSNFLSSISSVFGKSSPEQWVAVTSVSFDIAVLELFWTLGRGNQVIIYAGPRAHLAASDLEDFDWSGKNLQCTPSFASVFLEQWRMRPEKPVLKKILVGGEALSETLARDLLAVVQDGLFNMYGPTETTVWSSLHRLTATGGKVRIGRPIANTQMYVLNESMEPVPVGIGGELYIGGDGVTRGYLNRPELTAERFLPDRFGAQAGARLYRTGDLVRWRPDANLEFLGRMDEQVKLRGFRIELGEIEAVLREHEEVSEAVVMAGQDRSGQKRLVGYAVVRDGGETDGSELRRYLKERLPSYMVPAGVMVIEEMPLLPNGKLDRKRMPEWSVRGGEEESGEEEQTETEEKVGRIWARVLEVERVGREEDFFERGGHSLLVTQVVSRVREELGVEVSVRSMFEKSRMKEFAKEVEERIEKKGGGGAGERIERVRREGAMGLSYSQQRLWFMQSLASENTTWHIPVVVRLKGAVDVRALSHAVRNLMLRHETLRTTIIEQNGEPAQIVLPDNDLRHIDLEADALIPESEEVQSILRQVVETRFKFGQEPLARAVLLRLSDQEYILAFVMHHLIADGWSVAILQHSLAEAYNKALMGDESGLSPLELQFADFVEWERQWHSSQLWTAQLDYWQRKLRKLPVLRIPLRCPNAAVRPRQERRLVLLPERISKALTSFSQAERVTPFSIMLTALHAALARTSGQTDFGIGIPVSGRSRLQLEELIAPLVNTIVLRPSLDVSLSTRTWAHVIQETLAEALDNDKVSFQQVVERLKPERNIEHSPLFQVMASFNSAPSGKPQPLPGIVTEFIQAGAPSLEVDFILSLADTPDGLAGSFEFDASVFDYQAVSSFADLFVYLLEQIVCGPEVAVRDMRLIPEEQRRAFTILAEQEQGAAFSETWIEDAIFGHAKKKPSAIALKQSGRAVTYAELAMQAETLAQRLRQIGLRSGDLVAVQMPHSTDLVAAILGALRAGASCLPLGPTVPASRLDQILEDEGCCFLITQAGEIKDGDDYHVKRLRSSHIANAQRISPSTHLETEYEYQPAQVAFATGTGRTCGVIASGARVAAHVSSIIEDYRFNARDQTLSLAPATFEGGIESLLAPLCVGGTVLLPAHNTVSSVIECLRSCSKAGVTVLDITTTQWKEIAAKAGQLDFPLASSVRLVITRGHRLPIHLLQRWRQHVDEKVRLINIYGSAGVTVEINAASAENRQRAQSSIQHAPVGLLLPHCRAYVLDRELDLCPPGLIGDLYLDGISSGRQYLNAPASTAASYLPNPYSPAPGARMQWTGELACWSADGRCEVTRRTDDLITINGLLVDHMDVEGALMQHPEVNNAVVLAQTEEGVTKLIAYVLSDSDNQISYRDMVLFLRDHIPEYMLPSRVVYQREFPLSTTGEVDREAIAAIGAASQAATESGGRISESGVEAIMAMLWDEVLQRSEVGRDDNFFDLGGQSLSALRLGVRIQEAFGVEIPLQTLFDSPTFRVMVRAVDRALSEGTDAALVSSPLPCEGPTPLSFGQERLWFLEQLSGGGAQYNIPGAVRLTGHLNHAALERSLNLLLQRHSALRSAFRSDDQGSPFVETQPHLQLRLEAVDLGEFPPDERQQRVDALISQEAQRSFTLDEPPLFRALLLKADEQEHYLALTLHHIVGDGWSAGVLVRELGQAYAAYANDQQPRLDELKLEYSDYARWQRHRVSGEYLNRQMEYWRAQLEGVEALRLPGEQGRRQKPSYRGGRRELLLGEELSARLRLLGRQTTATLFMVLVAGWQLLLARYCGQSDIAVGTSLSNRPKREWENLVGFFVNTLVLRTKLHLGDTFRQTLMRVRQVCLGAYAHQDLPFERLVDELSPVRDLTRHPLFQTRFEFQDAPMSPLRLPGLEITPVPVSTQTAKLDLDMQVIDAGAEIGLSLQFSTDVIDDIAVEQLLNHYQSLLDNVSTYPDLPLQTLTQADKIRTGISQAVAVRPSFSPMVLEDEDLSLRAWFVKAVTKHSARVAVQAGTQTLTYGQLSEWADRVAHATVERCDNGNGRIALLCGRGPEMLASVFGALLANKTYVPLDPSWPLKRMKAIIADVEPEALLFESPFGEQAAALDSAVCLDVGQALENAAAPAPAHPVHPDHLAYVLYTSGSTGVPKGVMQSHRNVLKHIANYANGIRLGCDDRVTLFPSYCYDAAIMDIFGALLSGAALVSLDASAMEPEELAAHVQAERLTVLHATPTVFRHLLRGADKNVRFESVRAVVLGGEEAGPDIFPLFQERFSPDCVLVNGLGPTECTLALQYYCAASSRMSGKLPVGTPADGIRLSLVDEDDRPGALEGEIVLGGEQLSLGYWRRPELTSEVFLPDAQGQRAYRTGDLGRLLPDGDIEYAGRKDLQVKIQGSRVELNEIEAALSEIPGVLSCVIIVKEQGEDKQLLAYFTSSREFAGDEMRNSLAAVLPRYMLPARFIRIPEMPMLPNGKIARHALLNRDDDASTSRSFKLPRTWLEMALVEIWQQVLNTSPISIDDDFFALGGHSLLAPRLLSTIFRSIGCRLPLSVMFEAPTIESIASRIAAAQGREQKSPLVHMQPRGDRTKLFLVHPASGDVLCFRHLAMALGPGHAAFGLQDPAIATGETPINSIEEMAEVYRAAIETVEPPRPWVLGGWSFGGVVAFEMARQFAAAGNPPTRLILLDTWAPGQVTQELPLDDASLLVYIARVDFNLEVDVEELKSKTLDEQIALVSDRTGAKARSLEFVTSQLFRARNILLARREALLSYDAGQYGGPVTLFRATDTKPPLNAHGADPQDLGWSRLCSGAIEVAYVPGTHMTMALPPNVKTLASEITARLNDAYSSENSSEVLATVSL